MTNLTFDPPFRTILEGMRDLSIVDHLLSPRANNIEGDFIKYHFDDGQVSYRPAERMDVDDVWTPRGRIKGRTNRIIRKFIAPYTLGFYGDYDFERFHNRLEGHRLAHTIDVQIVSGEDIRRWYLGSNYSGQNTGTLHHSCMKHHRCQPYLDIYVENPAVCQMAIVLDDDGYLLSRALIWTLWNDNRMLDRVYGTDAMITAMQQWARMNGITPREDLPERHQAVRLKKASFPVYPYMDTLFRLDRDARVLANSGAFEAVTQIGVQMPLCVLQGTHGRDHYNMQRMYLIPLIQQISPESVVVVYGRIGGISLRGAQRRMTFALKGYFQEGFDFYGNTKTAGHIKGMAEFKGMRWRKMDKKEMRYFDMYPAAN